MRQNSAPSRAVTEPGLTPWTDAGAGYLGNKFPEIPAIATADCSRWVGTDPPPIVWTVRGLVPAGMVTLLISEGGAGKTLLMQTACTCIPTGNFFLGKSTSGGTAVGIFAEDDDAVLHRRQVKINKALGVDMESLGGRSFPVSWAGYDAPLWRDGGPTALLGELERQLNDVPDLRLICLDNTALVFAGNENDRIDVTGFLNALNGLARRTGAAVMLSHHTSKSVSDVSASRAGSGSTAWINAARSVLKLFPAHGDDGPHLNLIKANHVKPGESIDLKWSDGVLSTLVVRPEDEFSRRREIDRAIFATVDERWKKGDPASDLKQQGTRYLPRVLSRTQGIKARDAEAAMLDWIDSGHLVTDQKTTRARKGLKVERWPEW